MTSPFDARPIIVAIAGSNGAGKTTFYHAHIASAALRFVNADDLAHELALDAEDAARLAGALRRTLVELRESFAFETVFSDPVGDKVDFLRFAVEQGYTVVLCFIGIDSAAISDERVAMRVMRRAVSTLPHVLIFDNSDLSHPFRKVAEFRDGEAIERGPSPPQWFAKLRL